MASSILSSLAPVPTMAPMAPMVVDLDGPLPPPPPGFLPPPEVLAALPHDNGGPMLVVVIWVLSGLALLFLSLRIYCKFLRHSGLWWDDYVLIASWVSTRGCWMLWLAAGAADRRDRGDLFTDKF